VKEVDYLKVEVSIPFSKSGRSNIIQIICKEYLTYVSIPFSRSGRSNLILFAKYYQLCRLNPLFKVGAVKPGDDEIEAISVGLNPLFKVGAVKRKSPLL